MAKQCKDDPKENVIGWISGDDYISCTFTQKKYINKVRKIAQKAPNLVPIFVENPDGSIFCHLPLKVLKLSLITGQNRGFAKKTQKVVEDGEV